MTKKPYQIAFDPGTMGCGYSIWQNNKWLKAETIIPKGQDHLAKLRDLQEKLTEFYMNLLNEPGSVVSRVIIEEWERFIPRFKVTAMLKSAEGRGVLISVTSLFCKDICFVNKQQASKREAQWLAKKNGVIGSSHALDAYYLGILGGFGLG
ncbi:MAG: hypothetical protein ACP5VS_18795 [Desulfomonilaceae bacterium]